MLGAVVGDFVGSVHAFNAPKTKDFALVDPRCRIFEDAIRNAISLGGDADTLACITGAIAHAYYGGVPRPLAEHALAHVPGSLRDVWTEFRDRYRIPL